MPRLLRWSGVALGALAYVLVGCSSAQTTPPAAAGPPALDYSRESFQAGQSEKRSLPGPLRELEITTRVGRIEVEPGEDAKIHVQATKLVRTGLPEERRALADDVRLTSAIAEGKLTLKPSTPEPLSLYAEVADFDIIVKVPADWSGQAERTGPAASRRLRIETISGPVSLSKLRCSLQAATVSGRVSLDGLQGEAVVNTTEGNVGASGCAWSTARFNSSGGQVEAELSKLGAGSDVRVSSSVGNLKVLLPADADCRVEADTTAGRVTTRIVSLRSSLRYGNRSLAAALGEGRGLLKIQSTTGNIEINFKES